jgi:hypothetical protein
LLPDDIISDRVISAADILSPYAVASRYPGDAEPVSRDELASAVDAARDVVEWARRVVESQDACEPCRTGMARDARPTPEHHLPVPVEEGAAGLQGGEARGVDVGARGVDGAPLETLVLAAVVEVVHEPRADPEAALGRHRQ